MSSAAGDLVKVIYSFHYHRFILMLVPHSCKRGGLYFVKLWSWSSWRIARMTLEWPFCVTDRPIHQCMYITLKLAMFCFCCINCHVIHSSLLSQLQWTTQMNNSFSSCSFHLTYPSSLFVLVDFGSLVIYSCHSRRSVTLGMLLPHFFNSVCAQSDLFPDFTLFLPPPPCSFPLPKILCILIASIESGNHCSANDSAYCSVFQVIFCVS